MSPIEYIGESIEWWHQYVILLALALGLHWWLIKRWVVGLYDPLFMLLISGSLGWAIVWFMYLRGDIATTYVVSYTSAQLALYAGIGVGRRRPRVKPVQVPDTDPAVLKLTLITSAVVHIASTSAIWMIAGIPLFRSSRLGAFEGSGGLGILERLAEASSLISIFSLVFLLVRYRELRRNFLVLTFLAWYLASVAMSGSKGALLTMGQHVLSILFAYSGLRYRTDSFWGGGAGKMGILVATVFAIAILAMQQEHDLGTAGLAFIYRVVSYGDIFIFAYPEGTIELIKGDNAFIGLFGGFLSTFRLFPQGLVYPNIGYQFTGIIFPNLDLIVGPNPQHPVFGYHYFGQFAFVFSFILGLVTARTQVRFYFRRHSTFLSGLFAFMLYFTMVTISVDFEYTLSKLASMIIGLIICVGPVLLICPRAQLMRRIRRAPTNTVGMHIPSA